MQTDVVVVNVGSCNVIRFSLTISHLLLYTGANGMARIRN